jgi:cation:H+ antiporter
MTYVLLSLGLGLLILSGAALVEGASNIAARYGVPPAVIGLTVVAFGTSLPELAVNLSAVRSGNPGLGMGNIFGSNIANLGLVLGACVTLRGFAVESQIMRRELPLLLLISMIVTMLASDRMLVGEGSELDRGDAIVLLLLLSLFLYINITDILRRHPEDALMRQASSRGEKRLQKRHIFYILLGIPGLWLAGEITVDNAVKIALSLGVPEVLVGLSVIAVGTSLPELVTSVAAALRGQASLALGNVVGSNLLNVLFILPITALPGALPVSEENIVDIWAALLFTALVTLFAFTSRLRLSRWEGVVLLVGYLLYVGWRYTL